MIVWQGLGIFGFAIPVIAYYLAVFLADAVLGHGYSDRHYWPGALAVLLSAAAVWVLGKRLSISSQALTDPQTGQPAQLRRKHTLFSMDLRVIAVIVAVIAAYLMFAPRSWR